jgi:ketosteroid isomerase-like protein
VEQVSAAKAASARDAVVEHVVRLARAQDRMDWAAVAAAYTEDVEYVHPGGVLAGVDAIVARTRGALESLDGCQHLLGSHSVEVDLDVARSECYFHAQHVRAGTPGGEQYVIAGNYSDTLVRTADGWRISRRVQSYSWRNGNRAVIAR